MAENDRKFYRIREGSDFEIGPRILGLVLNEGEIGQRCVLLDDRVSALDLGYTESVGVLRFSDRLAALPEV